MTENSIREALPIYRLLIGQIRAVIAASADYATLQNLLNSFVSRTFLKKLSKHLQEAIEIAEAIGRSIVVEKDHRLGGEIAGKYKDLQWYVADDDVVRIAFNLLPKEAIDYIRYKALTIAGVENGKLLAAVKAQIERAIREGKTLREFRTELDQLFDAYGVTRLSSRHIDTVFRTNIFTAYSIGSQAQVEGMRDRFPLWRYSAILDQRTRPEHRDLDRLIFRTGEGPIPPIDYNCRCTAIYLHISQVERENLWDQVRDWNGSQVVRFNTRASFEDWRTRNEQAMNPEIRAWIDSNL